MKIQSRKQEAGGTGAFNIHLDYEELEYIAALLYNTRLGTDSVYKQAAFKLMNTIDFIAEAAERVDMSVSIVGADGTTPIATYSNSSICLEV